MAAVIVQALMEKRRGADGSITFTPIRIMDAEVTDDVDALKASSVSGIHIRTLQRMCEAGEIRSAYKRTKKLKSHWRMSLREVLEIKSASAA